VIFCQLFKPYYASNEINCPATELLSRFDVWQYLVGGGEGRRKLLSSLDSLNNSEAGFRQRKLRAVTAIYKGINNNLHTNNTVMLRKRH
jgi:hypothetical protein